MISHMEDRKTLKEKALLLQLQQGDRRAFAQLYEKYAQRLTIKLLQLVKSEEIALDLLQDIVIK